MQLGDEILSAKEANTAKKYANQAAMKTLAEILKAPEREANLLEMAQDAKVCYMLVGHQAGDSGVFPRMKTLKRSLPEGEELVPPGEWWQTPGGEED